MKKIDSELYTEYEFLFCVKAQTLITLRPQIFTQTEMARRCGVSLRKIQLFEATKCYDAYLLFAYKRLLRDE